MNIHKLKFPKKRKSKNKNRTTAPTHNCAHRYTSEQAKLLNANVMLAESSSPELRRLLNSLIDYLNQMSIMLGTKIDHALTKNMTYRN
ncbi:hypothetical protein [Synechococcus sp. RS9916]|uniref:hypothetical protein n=1 Tax=Synechococcus sp. RS9916 TaxID=221359 RepID=UPI0000E54805|nr:hypothetical protein [Synechococcus sp. RS9916]EAU72761.1 hypothetical protein RS9916_39536 [Synechococcus sp. RS9916]